MHSKPSFLREKQSKLGEPSHAEDRQLIDTSTQVGCPNDTRAWGTVQSDAMSKHGRLSKHCWLRLFHGQDRLHGFCDIKADVPHSGISFDYNAWRLMLLLLQV